MATVAQVLTAIAGYQAGIAGIVRAHDGNTLPDSLEDLPAFVSIWAFPGSGTIDYQPMKENHTYPIAMRLYLTKQDLAEASALAVGFFEPVRAAFRAHVRLGGLVTWCRIASYRVGSMDYAGETYYGIEFVLIVQDIQPVSPAA